MKQLILLSLLFPFSAFPWGATGHRAVGEIAQKNLSAKAAAEVTKILKGQNFARVATWPDEIKSEPESYKHTYNWHYTDWADDMNQHDETNSSGKLMTSINDQLKVLKDPAATQENKLFALKFLVHLVGDLHQPLHVGNGVDQGGNACKVTYHGKSTNLHALWDEEMINFTNLSFTEFAKFASMGRTRAQRAEIMKGTPLDWALESKNLRATIYPDNVAPSKEPMSVKEYCRKEVTAEAQPKLEYGYAYKFMPVVERRIFEAGLRLAYLLNQTF